MEALRQAECTVERHAAQELRKAKVEMAETRRQQEILALEMQEAETWKGLIDRLIDWLTDWLSFDWLSFDWLIGCLIDCLIDWYIGGCRNSEIHSG